ncbi:hypothetical protein LIER_19155 [Lithospermum erythrorhizon]|uniref:Uncharacterized protein n=1 Tax=Lithospermum erythrorhizon TaxID=34254 RepID=A0AAV3QJA6_LITER
MVTSSPSDERSPSLAYASSVELTLGRTPSPEYTPAADDHYVYRHRWVPLCGRLSGKLVSQLRDMEHDIFEQLGADLEDDPKYLVMCAALAQSLYNRELLSHADLHLVDSVAARWLLENDQASLSEVAVVVHRMEFNTGSVRAL